MLTYEKKSEIAENIMEILSTGGEWVATDSNNGVVEWGTGDAPGIFSRIVDNLFLLEGDDVVLYPVRIVAGGQNIPDDPAVIFVD